jgi:hypothetical protein
VIDVHRRLNLARDLCQFRDWDMRSLLLGCDLHSLITGLFRLLEEAFSVLYKSRKEMK